MADVKKDQERDELFRRIYKIATDLVHAGHVAEWDFKSYVLGTMFYRYISENFTAYINEGEYAAGNKNRSAFFFSADQCYRNSEFCTNNMHISGYFLTRLRLQICYP